MTADPWIVLTGHLEALKLGGLPALTPARRETIKDAVGVARMLFEPNTTRAASRHENMLMAVADVIAWDRWHDNHLRLLMAAVEIERASRQEIEHINRMVPVATSPRHMKGATG